MSPTRAAEVQRKWRWIRDQWLLQASPEEFRAWLDTFIPDLEPDPDAELTKGLQQSDHRA